MLVKNEPYQNGALTIGYDTSKRIVLDQKQELTVDPRVTGSSEDEMTISHMTSRWSYFYQFIWHDTDPVMIPMFDMRITPNIVTYFAEPLVYGTYQPTAMALAAMPFTWWRGDIEICLSIQCSEFHRGKLGILYEPNINQVTLINSGLTTHKNFIKVIDIQESRVVSFCVKWAALRSWLRVGTAGNADLNVLGVANATESGGFCNGFISIVPFTELQSPDSSDITVNMFIRSVNMKFNGLSTANMPTERKVVGESGYVRHRGVDDDKTESDSHWIDYSDFDRCMCACDGDWYEISVNLAVQLMEESRIYPVDKVGNTYYFRYDTVCPIHFKCGVDTRSVKRKPVSESGNCNFSQEVTCLELNPSTADDSMICEEHFGECPISWRALLKRFVSGESPAQITGSGSLNVYETTFPIMPYNRMAYTTSGFANQNLFSYLRYAFLGVRGGIRVRTRPFTNGTTLNSWWLKYSLAQPSNSSPATPVTTLSSVDNISVLEGTAVFCPSTNAGAEVELPFYSPNLWHFSFATDYSMDTVTDVMSDYWYRNFVVRLENPNFGGITISRHNIDRAAAEDFSLLRFQGAPFYTAALH
jgi:hypothetical protein